MEQKMITIPFNVELAKQIQNGEFPGKIVTRCGDNVRIVCWDKKSSKSVYRPIVALYNSLDVEIVQEYKEDGCICSGNKSGCDLMIQLYEGMYKEGEIIVCIPTGSYDEAIYLIKQSFFGEGSVEYYTPYCVLHKDEEYLFFEGDSNCDNCCCVDKVRGYATDEEKQQLIEALKKSTEPQAKEYLKRFFGIEEVEEKPKCEFEPFQKVLVRQRDFEKWECSLFSNYNKHDDEFPFVCVSGIFNQCIPYNENTKHLLGTTDNWEEQV